MTISRQESATGLMPSTALVAKLGYWTSLVGAILAFLWVLLAVGFGAAPWTGVQDYAETFRRTQVLNTAPALLLAPTMIMLFVAFHYSSQSAWKATTLGAMAFTCVYTSIITSIYILQLHTVSLNVLSGELEGISLLALPNFHSAFFALDTLGYFFLSAAGVMVAPLFGGDGRSRWIRVLLMFNGLLGLVGLLLVPFDLPWVVIAGGGLWGLSFPITMILISREFHAKSLKAGVGA